MEPLAARLREVGPEWQVIAICGDNPGLLAKLEAIAGKAGGRLHPVGFTDRVADFMAGSDLLITQPGAGSLAEAFPPGVPGGGARKPHPNPQQRLNPAFVGAYRLGLRVR